jgi:hypothetical protein
MASHTHRPAIREHGLQDDCERCAEHAQHPFESLDDDNLLALIARTSAWMRDEGDTLPRSDNEHAAMRLVEQAIMSARTMARLGVTF